MSVTDLVVVGAGPIGIACGVEAARAGISCRLLEKGCVTDAIFQFPPQLVFFSTPELLEIGDIPMLISGPKPSRVDLLKYYRRVAEHFSLDVRTHEKVLSVEGDRESGFVLRTTRGEHRARRVVLAVGFYDHPNLLGIPGEDLEKVSHYYTEPFPHYRRDVAVIGGQNSAAEAALELYRQGARVTLIHRGESLGRSVKYWVRPDLENRIAEGSIRAHFETVVTRIEETSIELRHADGSTSTIPNDFVFALTGYHADFEFLEGAGIRLEGEKRRPAHDPESMETNRPGVYIAGVATGGTDTTRIFIENGREHARRIAVHLETEGLGTSS